jgi:hypothetical protein
MGMLLVCCVVALIVVNKIHNRTLKKCDCGGTLDWDVSRYRGVTLWTCRKCHKQFETLNQK